MNSEHRRIIIKNIEQLVESTDVEALLPKLLEKGIFIETMLQKYQSKILKNGLDINLKRELYFEIPTRGPRAFKNLISALHESRQTELAMLLEPEGELVSIATSRHSARPFTLPQYFVKNPTTLISMKEFAESHPNCAVNLGTMPLNVHVKKSTKLMDDSFTYKTPIYSMSSNPKGYAMIINIKKYNDDLKKERDGAEHDETNLKMLFYQLGYQVSLHKDLTGEKMKNKLESFAKDQRHKFVDSCILAILSHGEQFRGETNFIAADGMPIPVSYVLELFSNEKCDVLRKKPKIFLFQSCRGDRKDHGIKQDFSRTTTDGVSHVRLRTYSDMLVAYSTVNGYESHRDLYLGTWFIQSICEVFMQHACDTEIMEMLKLVDAKLENLVSEDHTMQTTCFENRGFKTFFFNPGIYDG